jgi:hypothetical protein
VLVALLALLLEACGEAPLPVDAAGVTASQAASWRHRRTLAVDLDADAGDEELVIAADVELSADGTPLWEDGHRWAVFVAGPPVTVLYAAFVPNGHVEAAVLKPDRRGRRPVLVRERTPGQERTFVLAYDGAGSARAVSAIASSIDRRVPDLR